MRHARSVAEAPIATAAAASNRMESNVVHIAAQTEARTAQAVTALAERVHESVVETEARTSRTVGSVVQQLEREIEAAATAAAATSEMKTKSAVEGLRGEIKGHLDQNRSDFDCRQQETQTIIAQVSADLENLTRQPNQLKPMSEVDVSVSQNKLAVEVTEKLTVSDKKVEELTETVKNKQKTITDTAELLRDLIVNIENLGENVQNFQREVENWRSPEIQEAEMELENLIKEPEVNPA